MSDAKIERAEARLKQAREEWEAMRHVPDYSRLSSAELIANAKSPKHLTSEELEALDDAWLERFGVCSGTGD